MTRKDNILGRLIRTVQLLGDLSDEFIFVGGSVVPILVTDEAAPDARPTVDVDVVVQVFTRSGYYNIEKRLANVGFHLSVLESVICRFKNGDIILDVMPTDKEILKFGNRWYKQAASGPIVYPCLRIALLKLLTLLYFFAPNLMPMKIADIKTKKI